MSDSWCEILLILQRRHSTHPISRCSVGGQFSQSSGRTIYCHQPDGMALQVGLKLGFRDGINGCKSALRIHSLWCFPRRESVLPWFIYPPWRRTSGKPEVMAWSSSDANLSDYCAVFLFLFFVFVCFISYQIKKISAHANNLWQEMAKPLQWDTKKKKNNANLSCTQQQCTLCTWRECHSYVQQRVVWSVLTVSWTTLPDSRIEFLAEIASVKAEPGVVLPMLMRSFFCFREIHDSHVSFSLSVTCSNSQRIPRFLRIWSLLWTLVLGLMLDKNVKTYITWKCKRRL